MAERRIPFEEVDLISGLFGSFDSNIRILEDEYHVTAVNRGGELKLTGDDEAKVEAAARAVQGMLVLLKKGEQLNEQNIHYVISMVNEGADRKLSKLMADAICITSRGKPVKAKTLGQEAWLTDPAALGSWLSRLPRLRICSACSKVMGCPSSAAASIQKRV